MTTLISAVNYFSKVEEERLSLEHARLEAEARKKEELVRQEAIAKVRQMVSADINREPSNELLTLVAQQVAKVDQAKNEIRA
jgi:hypothetical protein